LDGIHGQLIFSKPTAAKFEQLDAVNDITKNLWIGSPEVLFVRGAASTQLQKGG
jgi:hypothetical protein